MAVTSSSSVRLDAPSSARFDAPSSARLDAPSSARFDAPSSVRLDGAYQISRETLAGSLPMHLSVRFTKRAIDLLISVVGLVVGAPLFAAIALAVRLDSPGPILYRQQRALGLSRRRRTNGQPRFGLFQMIKFRSMRLDAERGTGAILAGENDPRVTRVGRFLRRTRLDELPQLVNVLFGEMSVVGPRPERPELLGNLSLAIPFFEERLRGTRPGITGLAQVSLTYSGGVPAGSDLEKLAPLLNRPPPGSPADALTDDMRTKLLFDLAYVASLEHFGSFLRMELLILLKTPWVMLRGLGR